MDRNSQIADLKTLLRKDIAYLCRRIDGLWNMPIVEVLNDIQKTESHAVFFGGTLRSLLISRRRNLKLVGRPRDIDIVITGITVKELRKRFGKSVIRETRFGGLQVQRFYRINWQFDIWPLNNTWAFVNGNKNNPRFSDLPDTTFFNLEAIAIDVWPTSGNERKIYSGNDQFFDGILTNTLEINKEENPFPILCIVRSLVMASDLSFKIGPKLARYISMNGIGVHNDEIEDVQIKHYGRIKYEGRLLMEWIDLISEMHFHNEQNSIKLPEIGQLKLL